MRNCRHARGPGGGSRGVVPYADQNEASPALKGLRTAKLSPRSWVPGRSSLVVSYTQIRMRPRWPCGAAKCETVATFVDCWRVQPSDVMRRSERCLTALGGCELRNCRHVRGLLGGPAGWCHKQTRKRPPRPWGLRTAKLSLVSVAPGRPSRVVPHADQNEASPSPGAANCETVATFVGPRWVQRSGAIRISA